jgi:hypothetical protein
MMIIRTLLSFVVVVVVGLLVALTFGFVPSELAVWLSRMVRGVPRAADDT